VVAAVVGTVGISIIVADSLLRIARARKVAVTLGREQAPFWLTGGNIALSNLSGHSAAGSAMVYALADYLRLP
jgi:methylmalonyl-CoA mutase cobalamin-binding subunit